MNLTTTPSQPNLAGQHCAIPDMPRLNTKTPIAPTSHNLVTVAANGEYLRLRLPTDATARFHAIWLRHNTPEDITKLSSPTGRHNTTAQLPTHCTITRADLHNDQLHIEFAPDGHRAQYSINWLAQHVYDVTGAEARGWIPSHCQSLTAHINSAEYTAEYSALLGNTDTLMSWLEAIRTYGLGRVTAGPTDPKALDRLVNRFTTIHPTGRGRIFDAAPHQCVETNTVDAFYGAAIAAHTQAPYRATVPGLHIMYCLENTLDTNPYSVIDGFTAAERMRATHGLSFDLLSDYCAQFSYHRPNETALTAKTPLISIAPDGELTAIALDQRYLQPLTHIPYPHLPNYYRALGAFTDILTSPDLTVTVPLEPGDALVVDNHRTLLARDSFTPQSGNLKLQGCYGSADGLTSTWTILKGQRSTVSHTPR